MKNTDLKQKYNDMHHQGPSAWFDDGREEREAIFTMGKPWQGKTVLEVGCGEGHLLDAINQANAITHGIDYSLEAIAKAKTQYPYLDVMCCDWTEWPDSRNQHFDVLVMQGVLEHMDDWRQSLTDMILTFRPKTIITSMPSFINIRGIVWHTLDMLGAVMSKTDLHYIDPWEVKEFCSARHLPCQWVSIDLAWGNGKKMIEDFQRRIPLALEDGFLRWSDDRLDRFLVWLERAMEYFEHDEGAVNIYRIDL
jgi:SAM-dependent methyltransferase